MLLLYRSFHALQLCECFNVRNITVTLMESMKKHQELPTKNVLLMNFSKMVTP